MRSWIIKWKLMGSPKRVPLMLFLACPSDLFHAGTVDEFYVSEGLRWVHLLYGCNYDHRGRRYRLWWGVMDDPRHDPALYLNESSCDFWVLGGAKRWIINYLTRGVNDAAW
jgi:hypothetical protein